MKFNKIIFSIVVLFILMSCVSATDNTTSQITQDNAISMDDMEMASDINITFDEKVYKEDLSNISVDLPENVHGNLEVRINNYTFYNETVNTTSLSIPIELPPQKLPIIVPNVWPPIDATTYKITAFYNNVELNVTHDLIVMLYPKNYTPSFMIPEEVLQFCELHYYMPAIMFPRSATGEVEIYLDEKLINRTKVNGPFVNIDDSLITSLSLGIHKLSYNYTGDDYFIQRSGILMFNVTDAVINIPKSIYLDHDDCISVYTKTNGYVSVYIDSSLITKKALDKRGEFLYSLFNDITCGAHEIKVVVETKEFKRTKIVNVNTTYSMEIYLNRIFRYGENNVVEVYIPEDMNEKLFKVTINNKTVSAKKSGQDLLIDISKLAAGNYTIDVAYMGDKKYYPLAINGTFSIHYGIEIPDCVEFNDGSCVDIILPTDAKGSLNVYLNDVLFKSSKLVDGKASIMLNNLNPGEYVIMAVYSGNDYDVASRIGTLTAYPDIIYESYVCVGDSNILQFKVPKSCKGKISAKIGSKTYLATIKNGLATFDLSNLDVGDWDFDIDYVGDDGYKNSYFAGVYVDYAPIKIKSMSAKLLYGVDVYKVKVIGKTGKVIKNAAVTFKINGKKVKTTKTNSKGIAKLKLPYKYGPKKYTVTAIYKSAKLSKKVSVKHLLTLKTIKIKKSSKLVLKASLKKSIKGKKVTFKFKGKKYTAKTNKKGIAKVVIKKSVLKKLKVGSKVTVKATYLKDTVKKSIKINK